MPSSNALAIVFLAIGGLCCPRGSLLVMKHSKMNGVNPVHNLEIGMQFRDAENAQHNLEIVQIPRLHETYIYICNFHHAL